MLKVLLTVLVIGVPLALYFSAFAVAIYTVHKDRAWVGTLCQIVGFTAVLAVPICFWLTVGKLLSLASPQAAAVESSRARRSPVGYKTTHLEGPSEMFLIAP